MSEIINKWWFTDSFGRLIGIIKTKDSTTNEEKFRIGIGGGIDEEEDLQFILNHGARLYPEILK